jgi:hypothetical protein
MRYILLSADGLPSLYEAPDKVAEKLSDYCFRFLDEINGTDSPFVRMIKAASGTEYALLSYTEQDFLNWLNSQPETAGQPVREAELISKEQRELIMETARRERVFPYERQQYPWFNF